MKFAYYMGHDKPKLLILNMNKPQHEGACHYLSVNSAKVSEKCNIIVLNESQILKSIEEFL